ncbi:MAG: hypothetical protein AB8G95_08950 [Anaerolineae bacterium]
MELEKSEVQKRILTMYARELGELGESGTQDHLDRGAALNKKHNLAKTLKERGMLVFPHISVHDCGYQTAACVHAALDSGAKRVVAISVLHAFTQEMDEARIAVAAGANPSEQPFYGIQGPGLNETTGHKEWTGDHALMTWRHFWNAEIKRRGMTNPPEMIERYPWLAGGKPGELPGIDELARLCEDAVIVATADPVHHGIGYGTPADEAFEPDEAGIAMAEGLINEGIELMIKQDYWGYNQHTIKAKSDHRDAGQVMAYLRKPVSGKILDMSIGDFSETYDSPPPTWVAGPLVEWKVN